MTTSNRPIPIPTLPLNERAVVTHPRTDHARFGLTFYCIARKTNEAVL